MTDASAEGAPRKGARQASTLLDDGWGVLKFASFPLLVLAVTAGCIALVLRPSTAEHERVLGIAMYVGASLLVGALIGFIFGIPRSMQADGPPAGGDAARSGPGFGENTSLEQVSDWLTKILIGVGLTQFMQIVGTLSDFAAKAAPLFASAGGASGADRGVAAAGAAMVLFAVAGFICTYLWTRMFMAGALAKQRHRDSSFYSRQEIDTQNEIDGAALRLVDQYLSTGQLPAGVSEGQLLEYIQKASPVVRAGIFSNARQLRRESYDKIGTAAGPASAQRAARTIPVFEALGKADPTDHQIWGQLGYAYKDKPGPDWKKSEEALNEAIRLRGADGGFQNYEFVRAIARIMQERENAGVRAIDSKRLADIVSDLEIARDGDCTLDPMRNEQAIGWLSQNGVDPSTLKRVG